MVNVVVYYSWKPLCLRFETWGFAQNQTTNNINHYWVMNTRLLHIFTFIDLFATDLNVGFNQTLDEVGMGRYQKSQTKTITQYVVLSQELHGHCPCWSSGNKSRLTPPGGSPPTPAPGFTAPFLDANRSARGGHGRH